MGVYEAGTKITWQEFTTKYREVIKPRVEIGYKEETGYREETETKYVSLIGLLLSGGKV